MSNIAKFLGKNVRDIGLSWDKCDSHRVIIENVFTDNIFCRSTHFILLVIVTFNQRIASFLSLWIEIGALMGLYICWKNNER